MTEETRRPWLKAEGVRALALGVTEDQIRDIVSMVGFDRASILREAREIRQAMKKP
ncbi:hypothetical protein [Mesorhizobium sp. L48C026A00]|uniref:hypothetical protein n=1 Tax=Mesorhizobium sp. L48C026A00 TaxID=1287182 RepID=UPI0003D03C78|nr:hypothetical protein [Mesorhizobium sp. L48C026A00]ESZ13080.1 hypothetical protein X737_26750 [Mesorhizobium sp. L48C026A00]